MVTICLMVGRGNDKVGNPHRAHFVIIRVVRAYPLTEIRQAGPRRAIRGNSSQQHPPPLLNGETMDHGCVL